MSKRTEAEAAIETVRRYLAVLPALREVIEELPIDAQFGTLAVIAGLGQLLSERALTAYVKVREARGLAPLVEPMPDAELLRQLVEKIEPCGGDVG